MACQTQDYSCALFSGDFTSYLSRLHMAILHWPLSSAATMEVQGPDTTWRRIQGLLFLVCWVVYGCYLYLLPLFLEPGDWKDQCGPLPPSFKPTWAEPHLLPLQVPTPPPCKDEGEADLDGNHTLASDSRSEAADWARGGCGDHFGLFSAPVRGQGSELEASAGWPARFFIALLYTISGKSGRAGTTKTHPWQASTGQESI